MVEGLKAESRKSEALMLLPPELEGRVRFTANALEIERGLSFEEWKALGWRLRGYSRAVNLWIGDWLAYGEFEYRDAAYGKRLPNGVYDIAAEIFDRQPKTLRNYKWVCSSIEPAKRTTGFTMQHGLELLSAHVPPSQIGVWIREIEAEGMKTRPLRRRLRDAYTTAPPEPQDDGDNDILSQTNQWVIDFQRASRSWTDEQWRAYRELLDPVFRAFDDREMLAA